MPKLIREFADREAWDAFVEGHPEARFCQLFGYSELCERVYGYRPRYFAFEQDGALLGVLPAMDARSLVFGRKLVSQPFLEYGGFLLQPGLCRADREAIVELMRGELRALGIAFLELHGVQGLLDEPTGARIPAASPHQIAELMLDDITEEQLWSERVAYAVRKAVRQAEKKGLNARSQCDESVLRSDFYPLYVRSMMRLGVPPHPLRYYLEAHERLGARMKIFWAVREGRPVAGLLGFVCGRRVNIVNTVSDERFWSDKPNDLVHWAFVRWALAEGCEVFDFGSVRYEGQAVYKRKWGCRFLPHAHRFLAADDGKASHAPTFDSHSKLMRRLSKIWQAFVPSRIATVIGPPIRRQLVR